MVVAAKFTKFKGSLTFPACTVNNCSVSLVKDVVLLVYYSGSPFILKSNLYNGL